MEDFKKSLLEEEVSEELGCANITYYPLIERLSGS